MNKNSNHFLLCLLTTILITINLTSAVDFLINRFQPPDVSLFSDAKVEHGLLTLTSIRPSSIGRAIYPSKIPTKHPNNPSLVLPFSASFIFAMVNYGYGLIFCFVPHEGLIQGFSSGPLLGLVNSTSNGNPHNHVFGIEFDVFKDEAVEDIDGNHVGIDVNSLVSVKAHEAGYWADEDKSFKKLTLNNGKNYQAWIDYVDGATNVTIAPVGTKRPNQPLLSVPLNLSEVLLDEMYVGFSAAGGATIGSYHILGWSFSNTNISLSEGLITRGLPNFELRKTMIYKTKGFIAGLTISGFLFFTIVIAYLLVRRNKRIRRKREEIEDWELEYWPHRISYPEIVSATNNFSEENVIGIGGNGKVYKGMLPGGTDVAVKRISDERISAFLAEISTLGRLKHRNLVQLRGWCKKDKGNLILVYHYMQNGSLDKRVLECDESKMLNCEDRIKILKQVASAIQYLHYGWESKVLHRDIKASNVLLDKEMNARLGDFGLAWIHDHDKTVGTTRMIGTVGYLAPEIVRTGRATTQTDVFGYGALILEVICGRRPIEQGKPLLVDWLWELFRKRELVNGVDPRLRAKGVFDEEKVEKMLHLGLLCAHPDPGIRPTMRQVVELFDETSEVDEPERQDMKMYILEKMNVKEI